MPLDQSLSTLPPTTHTQTDAFPVLITFQPEQARVKE
jgi:hypothetical protein